MRPTTTAQTVANSCPAIGCAAAKSGASAAAITSTASQPDSKGSNNTNRLAATATRNSATAVAASRVARTCRPQMLNNGSRPPRLDAAA